MHYAIITLKHLMLRAPLVNHTRTWFAVSDKIKERQKVDAPWCMIGKGRSIMSPLSRQANISTVRVLIYLTQWPYTPFDRLQMSCTFSGPVLGHHRSDKAKLVFPSLLTWSWRRYQIHHVFRTTTTPGLTISVHIAWVLKCGSSYPALGYAFD